jgi:hypothetical protein
MASGTISIEGIVFRRLFCLVQLSNLGQIRPILEALNNYSTLGEKPLDRGANWTNHDND